MIALIRNGVFLCCLCCLSVADWRQMVIPDRYVLLPALVWFLALPWTWPGWHLAAAHIGTGLGLCAALRLLAAAVDRRRGSESLGGGDIKLFALAGLYLGPVKALFAVLFSCAAGAPLALLCRHMRRPEWEEAFPFGPAIALSSACMLLWGDAPAAWYLGLLKSA